MGANHLNWDYREEVSLSHHLQTLGWDVWIPELRGDPGATPPHRKDKGRFDFDDHARYDLPVVVDTVLAETGRTELDWVGHSMGGMLLYTALSDYPDKVRSGVAICSPATFDNLLPMHEMVARQGWALKGNGVIPAKALGAATAGLGKANPAFRRIANPKNLDWKIAKAMGHHALNDLPRPMAAQASRWLREGAFTSSDGEPWVVPVQGDQTPILVFGAVNDRVSGELDVATACGLFGNCEYVRLSKADGFALDYGHIDPVLGKTAPSEVWPLISDFLYEQHTSEMD
jgi:pimeloyl-ACP methyl ester carboxylesterase